MVQRAIDRNPPSVFEIAVNRNRLRHYRRAIRRREQFAFNLASHATDRFRWLAGAELSHRDLRSIVPGAVLTAALLSAGSQLKQVAQIVR
jgi:hypothetical protein